MQKIMSVYASDELCKFIEKTRWQQRAELNEKCLRAIEDCLKNETSADTRGMYVLLCTG